MPLLPRVNVHGQFFMWDFFWSEVHASLPQQDYLWRNSFYRARSFFVFGVAFLSQTGVKCAAVMTAQRVKLLTLTAVVKSIQMVTVIQFVQPSSHLISFILLLFCYCKLKITVGILRIIAILHLIRAAIFMVFIILIEKNRLFCLYYSLESLNLQSYDVCLFSGDGFCRVA